MGEIADFLARPNLAKFPFVFVVSYGRSGSTLLQGLLSTLPGYRIVGENFGTLIHVFRAHQAMAQAKEKFGFKPGGPEYPWYRAHEFAAEQFAQRCCDAFLACAMPPGPETRCVGFKEIRYLEKELTDEEFQPYFDFIETCFPGAAFVCNVRDVVETRKSSWWAAMPPEDVSDMLTHARQRLENLCRQRPDRAFLFDYDQLSRDPAYFNSLCDFLGETPDNALTRETMARRHSF